MTGAWPCPPSSCHDSPWPHLAWLGRRRACPYNPRHRMHTFLQPADVHHAIPLTAREVLRMHAKDDVPVAVGASERQPDRISRSGEQSLPAAASSPLKPSRVTRSATTASQAAPPLSFPVTSRFGGECPGTGKRICTERGDISVTAGTQTLQAWQRGTNTLNHSSSHRHSYITNLFSPYDPENFRR